MRCPDCKADVIEGSVFCNQCGAQLALACEACGTRNPAGAQFCNRCGQALTAAPVPSPEAYTPPHLREKILAGRQQLEGERKQVTVLFADVRGSMDLQEQVDPEDWRTIMDGFFHVLSDGVHRYEGTVTQFTGDGIMALFGAPIAHEDHAQRACYAALQLQEDVKRYAGRLRRQRGLEFAVRLGLNSGEVVVGGIGDDLTMEYTALGHTVGLAQRMEVAADPGTAFLSEHTAHLVEGFFELSDLGAQAIKGVQEPLHVFELRGVGAARTHMDVAQARGLSKFVGRDAEMQSLRAALARARQGDGGIVGVVALAGTGKSRLCYEFVEQCRADGMQVLEGHGVAHGKDVPFLPALEFLRGYFGIHEGDSPEIARRKVRDAILPFDRRYDEVLPVLYEFLAVGDPERPAPRMDPEARQQRVFGLCQELTRRSAGPLLFLFEDLHWFDAASLGFVEAFVEAVPGAHAVLLVSFRPEFEAEWMHQTTYQQLALAPLDALATGELVDDLVGQDPSLNGVPQLLREGTGGNPFFIEEAVQDLAEHGGLAGKRGSYTLMRPIEELTIPASVQAVLDARIDRLPEGEKQVLQTAAVIGRAFGGAVLGRVAQRTRDELGAALQALVGAEFLFKSAVFPEVEYTFKHALTQEVAYHSQLTDRRTRTHGAVAEAIEVVYPDNLDERAAVIAHHYEVAGDNLPAATWHRRAARWIGPTDTAEAFRHWRRVGALLEAVPASGDSLALRIEACIQMVNFGWRAGMSESLAAELFAEGKALAEQAEAFGPLAFLYTVYAAARGHAGDVRAYVALNVEGAELAERAQDRGVQAAAFVPVVYSLFCSGRLREALRYAERGLELTRIDQRLGFDLIGFRPYAFYTCIRGLLLAPLGRIREAARIWEEAIPLAREHEHDVEPLGWTYGDVVSGGWYTGDAPTAQTHAVQAVEIAEKIGSPFSRVLAYGWRGLAYLTAEDWPETVAAMEQTLDFSRTRGIGREKESYYLAWLARALLETGEPDRARATAEEALALAQDQGATLQECGALAALARVLLRTDGAAAAEQVGSILQQALVLIAEHGYAMEEPFIRMELAELARVTGDAEAQKRELREAHRLFTEMGAPIRAQHVAELLQQS